jgi:hypothetical protein
MNLAYMIEMQYCAIYILISYYEVSKIALHPCSLWHTVYQCIQFHTYVIFISSPFKTLDSSAMCSNAIL